MHLSDPSRVHPLTGTCTIQEESDGTVFLKKKIQKEDINLQKQFFLSPFGDLRFRHNSPVWMRLCCYSQEDACF